MMQQTDNTLRTEMLLLATKALDIITKLLDMMNNGNITDSPTATATPAVTPTATVAPAAPPTVTAPPNLSNTASATAPDKPAEQAKPDSYRADAIRFNERFLHDRYELRYNTMLRTTEFRPRPCACSAPGGFPAGPASGPSAVPASGSSPVPASGSSPVPASGPSAIPASGSSAGPAPVPASSWRPITDRDLNGLTVEQLLCGGSSWGYGMKLCIDSTRVESFNPVDDYLSHLPRWDGRDHIGALAARVPTAYAGWPRLFRRWLLAMVAQARGLSADHGNSLVPLLIGDQGTGKSTFCKMLLPRHLRQYYMDDIKMDSPEQVERVLGRMWLVNIDEYDSKTQREQAKIKRLLTERDVQVRRPRSDQYTLVRRVCSFIATTNERRPLADATGSRRYLCVELTGAIDTESPIDHDQLFAQALHLLGAGEPFFLTRSEERAMERHNRRYCRQMVLADAIGDVLQPAPTGADTLLTATDIMDLLADGGLRPQDMPSPRQLVQALRAAGLRQGAQQGRHGWYCKQK